MVRHKRTDLPPKARPKRRGAHREKFYIRFQSPPVTGRSRTQGITGKDREEGVSVYPAQWSGDLNAWVIPPIHSSGLSYLYKMVRHSRKPRGRMRVYLVKGDEIGKGTDDEPLLRHVEVIKELDCEDVLSRDFDIDMGSRRGRGKGFRKHHGKWGKRVPCEPLESHYPERNPKPFKGRPHDWDEVLISRPGKKLTRKQIRDYYVRNEKKIWPFLKGQTVLIIFASKRNTFIRRRNGPDGTHIKLTKLKGIDDPSSYEYWVNRRVIEFHPVLTSKTTPILWLDLDMHKTSRKDARRKLLAKMRRAVPKLKKAFKEMGVTKVHVYTSGTQGGIHLSGNLPSRRSVDTTRKKFRAVLDEMFADDYVFTTGPEKSGQIRLDTTTFHRLGSLRAPYSMTVHGDAKKPIGKP